MQRGALLLYDCFLEKFEDVRLDTDYAAGIKPEDTQGPNRNLFAAILIRGIRDVTGENKQHRDSAQEWLDSNNTHIASFRYICDVLDLNATKLREKITDHIERKNAGLPGTISMPYLRT